MDSPIADLIRDFRIIVISESEGREVIIFNELTGEAGTFNAADLSRELTATTQKFFTDNF